MDDAIAGLAEFDKALRSLGKAVFRAVEGHAQANAWARSSLEVRYSQDGSSWLTKIRATLPSGEIVSVHMNNEIDLLLIDLSTHRLTFRDQWYSLVLEMDHDGSCTVRYGYDAKCSEDDAFFES